MKITCTKKDEIMKRRDEWNARKQQVDDHNNQLADQYRQDRADVANRLISKIRNDLGTLPIDINIDAAYPRFGLQGYEIVIYNDKYSSPFTWKIAVSIDNEGQIKKESSSWSGLDVTNADNIQYLQDCIDTIKVIDKIDWQSILSEKGPNYADYAKDMIDTSEFRDKPNFNMELFEAEIDEAVGTNIGFLCSESKFYRGEVYSVVVKQTPKMVTIADVPVRYVNEDGKVDGGPNYNLDYFLRSWYNITKAKFYDLCKEPLITKELY